jgi:hypothetical protein
MRAGVKAEAPPKEKRRPSGNERRIQLGNRSTITNRSPAPARLIFDPSGAIISARHMIAVEFERRAHAAWRAGKVARHG